jgi:tRNA A37 threonylcarbamoyltransferase TsaD
VRQIHALTARVFKEAGIRPADVGAIAATNAPGLAGALLSGIVSPRAWRMD